MARRRNKGEERRLAQARIDRLLDLAEHAARAGRDDDARRYTALSWALKTRHLLPTPRALKAATCRSCHTYLLVPRTARVRLHGGKVSTTCLHCGRIRRRPLAP